MAAATAVALAALAVSAYSASAQTSAANKQAKAQEAAGLASAKEQRINAMLNKIDAERIEKASNIEADKIREVAIQMRGQQESAQAVSGAQVGSGSHLVMTEDTTKRAEADALATVMEGIHGTVNKNTTARYMEQAANASILSGGLAASASLQAGQGAAIATLGSGFSSAYSNYKMMNTPSTPQTSTVAPSTD